jgi:hypothetical protein
MGEGGDLPRLFRRRSGKASSEPPGERDNLVRWATVIGAVAAVIAAIATKPWTIVEPAKSHTSPALTSSVVVRASYVQNESEESYPTATPGLTAIQTLASTPTIDVEVHNNSTTTPAYVRAASAHIERYGRVHLCFSQGGGGVILEPAPTVIALHQYPLGSERDVPFHLHYEVTPEGNRDIPIRFSTRSNYESGYSLYRLHVRLWVLGDPKPLDAGRFVLSAPVRVPPEDGFFPIDNSYFSQFVSKTGDFRQSWLSVYWCMRENTATVEELLDGSAKSAPELELLKHPILASEWNRVRNRTPLPLAVKELLAQGASTTAAFVASANGDQQLEAQTRNSAAKQLVASAAKALKTPGPPVDELQVRQALTLDPSVPGGTQLLAEYERRTQVADAEAESKR